jgi:hypothetical protein
MDANFMKMWDKLPDSMQADLQTLWMAQMAKLIRGPKDPVEVGGTYMYTSVEDHMLRMRGEMLELEIEIARGHPPIKIWKEAADVCNFATFVAVSYTSEYHDKEEE